MTIDTATLPDVADPKLLAKLFERGMREGMLTAADIADALAASSQAETLAGPDALLAFAKALRRVGSKAADA